MRQVVVPAIPDGGLLALSPEESHHLLRVLRLPRGSLLRLSDGRGRQAEARLERVEEGRAGVEILSWTELPALPARLLLLGLPRAALLEEALTLATEAGLTELRMIRARYSPPGDPRMDRLDRVLHAAATQCRRVHLPEIRPACPLAAALEGLPEARWIAQPEAPPLIGSAGAAALAVGPEGGWAPEELALLEANGFRRAGLGAHILRTPTAVAVGLGRLFA